MPQEVRSRPELGLGLGPGRRLGVYAPPRRTSLVAARTPNTPGRRKLRWVHPRLYWAGEGSVWVWDGAFMADGALKAPDLAASLLALGHPARASVLGRT